MGSQKKFIEINKNIKNKLIEKAKASGFDTSKLIFVTHDKLPVKTNSADNKSKTAD